MTGAGSATPLTAAPSFPDSPRSLLIARLALPAWGFEGLLEGLIPIVSVALCSLPEQHLGHILEIQSRCEGQVRRIHHHIWLLGEANSECTTLQARIDSN